MITHSAILKNGESNDGDLPDALRQKSLTIFIQAVAEIEKILRQDEEETLPTFSQAMSVAAMSAQARSRASKQKTRHELATLLAADALRNADNLQWDPFDRTTEMTEEQSSDLLQWLLEQPAPPSA